MQDVTLAQAKQGILDTSHGQGGARGMVRRLLIMATQVRVHCGDPLPISSLSMNVLMCASNLNHRPLSYKRKKTKH